MAGDCFSSEKKKTSEYINDVPCNLDFLLQTQTQKLFYKHFTPAFLQNRNEVGNTTTKRMLKYFFFSTFRPEIPQYTLLNLRSERSYVVMLVVLLGGEPSDSLIHLQSNKLDIRTEKAPGMCNTGREAGTYLLYECVFKLNSHSLISRRISCSATFDSIKERRTVTVLTAAY